MTGSADAPDTPTFLTRGHGVPYAGVPSFARVAPTRDLEDADLVVMGVPFDLGAVNRPGARFGPQAIRRQSVVIGSLQPVYPWDEALTAELRIVDYGDIAPVPGVGAVEEMLEATRAAAAQVFAGGASLLTLGGDHTLPYGPIRAAAEAFGKLALVHLDAHQDSIDGESVPGGRMLNHATFATDLVREGCIDPARSAQLYIRTRLDNPGGYTIIYADEAIDLGPQDLAARVRELAGDAPVYVTLDIDAIDPAFAPGCGTPVPGGPTSREVRRFLRCLDGLDVVGADLVEVNPAYDPAETTAILAATLSFDLLHLMANARRRR